MWSVLFCHLEGDPLLFPFMITAKGMQTILKNLRYCFLSKEKNLTTPSAQTTSDKFLTIPEVAAYLKISKSKIYYLVSRKEIPHLKLGRNVRIRESDLQKWLELQIEEVPKTFSDFAIQK